MRAPDYVAPLEGWRLWHVVERYGELRLVSPLYRIQWPARRELVAACRRGLEPGLSLYPPRTRHAAPSPGCGCGIYGSCGPVQAAAYMSRFFKQREDVVHRVIGTVSLWGEVVECDSGWRSSFAYPTHIYVPVPARCGRLKPGRMKPPRLPAEEIAFGLADYGLPVELVECASIDDLAEIASRTALADKAA